VELVMRENDAENTILDVIKVTNPTSVTILSGI
jgi:hypothetical protein